MKVWFRRVSVDWCEEKPVPRDLNPNPFPFDSFLPLWVPFAHLPTRQAGTPHPSDAPHPGARLVVSDAPGTARMWMRPARRLRPVAAWLGEAMPGSTSGPPLARWLAGYMPEVPKGVLAFLSPPPEAGGCRTSAGREWRFFGKKRF